jgi:hypothetical protein
VVLTWGEPAGMEAASIVGALRPLLPPPPPGAAGPFALSDREKLRGLAVAAGLAPEEIVDLDSGWAYPDLETGVRGLGSSGVATFARGLVGPEAVDEAHRAALTRFRQDDGTIRIRTAWRFLVARV